jgi:GTP-binding protein Era
VIGKRGQMLKTIGQAARVQSEKMLGAHVYLSLRVKVERDWTERADGLKKMGYA